MIMSSFSILRKIQFLFLLVFFSKIGRLLKALCVSCFYFFHFLKVKDVVSVSSQHNQWHADIIQRGLVALEQPSLLHIGHVIGNQKPQTVSLKKYRRLNHFDFRIVVVHDASPARFANVPRTLPPCGTFTKQLSHVSL